MLLKLKLSRGKKKEVALERKYIFYLQGYFSLSLCF